MKVSVALATYNGEKFIKEQLDSILCQLSDNDEVVVSDNGSTDKTTDIVKSYNDPRIKLIACEKKGVVNNFNNALQNASGDIIFFCDQDDVWEKDKVSEFKKVNDPTRPTLIISDGECVDEHLNPNGDKRVLKRGYFKNLIKTSYVGAFMAINRPLLKEVGLVPQDFVLHDVFYSLVSEKMKYNIVHVKKKLTLYRRHAGTQTGVSPYGFFGKIKLRISIANGVNKAVKQIKGKKNNG